MFERPKSGERAILVQLSSDYSEPEKALAEFEALALSAQAEIVDTVTGAGRPEVKYYLGLGKVEELEAACRAHQAELVLVNHELSPSQERNLEQFLKCRVVDRIGLILDIFSQRAQSFEGKLQVELAQLQHLSTRLVRGWTHLERQKGGIGLRGPGETQLETDRRLLRERIKFIRKRLEKVKNSRAQNRRARLKANRLTVSLVGYTNAGKSSLFEKLTGKKAFTANQLFATLDLSIAQLSLPGSAPVILADTVGFIQNLPHQLIEAFHATLEETEEAQLLLHVIDIADPDWRNHMRAVEKVLEEIINHEIPTILVFNKIDLQANWQAQLQGQENQMKVWISSKTGEGLDLLREAIVTQLQGLLKEETIHIPLSKAKLRAELYAIKAVEKETVSEEGFELKVKLTAKQRLLLLGY